MRIRPGLELEFLMKRPTLQHWPQRLQEEDTGEEQTDRNFGKHIMFGLVDEFLGKPRDDLH